MPCLYDILILDESSDTFLITWHTVSILHLTTINFGSCMSQPIFSTNSFIKIVFDSEGHHCWMASKIMNV
ncbi:unnamed protein product [Musa acuminata subsp. malaccensis]|uniref:(wild Malaysian banana) hypothetical protein n=1 Tax=Musa acuminata subsp. malaccensis TaxID=214687 RepID=A0A804JT68_MUSAM|nr:unnamed protein product [Musa acuminata subsp. malaccensis]